MVDFRRRVPLWFRAAALVLLLWGVAGCWACYQQFRLGADAMGPASAADRALYDGLPVWYNAVYAVAVGTGFLGALALLARSVLARPLYVISLVAVLVQFGWVFATTDLLARKGAVATLPFPVVIVAVAAFGVWLAGHARARRWIA